MGVHLLCPYLVSKTLRLYKINLLDLILKISAKNQDKKNVQKSVIFLYVSNELVKEIGKKISFTIPSKKKNLVINLRMWKDPDPIMKTLLYAYTKIK